MTSKKEFEEELARVKRGMGYQGAYAIGNDIAFFGCRLKDTRLQLAFSRGWMLAKHTYNDVDYYEVIPPPQSEPSLNTWCAVQKRVDTDGVQISYPSWYYENDVLLYGKRER